MRIETWNLFFLSDLMPKRRSGISVRNGLKSMKNLHIIMINIYIIWVVILNGHDDLWNCRNRKLISNIFFFRNGLHKNTRNKHMILLNLPARYKWRNDNSSFVSFVQGIPYFFHNSFIWIIRAYLDYGTHSTYSLT